MDVVLHAAREWFCPPVDCIHDSDIARFMQAGKHYFCQVGKTSDLQDVMSVGQQSIQKAGLFVIRMDGKLAIIHARFQADLLTCQLAGKPDSQPAFRLLRAA